MASFTLRQALHVFRNSLLLKIRGITRYGGDAHNICSQIVRDCWNGRFFKTSTTHFPQFWTRDFGWCTESLLKLGYKEEVWKTLVFALERFSRFGRVTTTIGLDGKPFDFPTYAVDSLPWLVHSLQLLGNKDLISRYGGFLDNDITRFVTRCVDTETGLVQPRHFSSMKDFAIRRSSCYDNTLLGFLSRNLKTLKLPNPLREYNYAKILRDTFWNGEYFYDDARRLGYVAGDAQVFPFYCGVVSSRKMLRSAVGKIRATRLDVPFPLRYTQRDAPTRFIWQEIFMRGYERNAVWTHMGPLYIALVKRIDKGLAWRYLDEYTRIIETHKNYLEVFAPDGKPFETMLYHSDQGMLWAANYLTLNT